MFLDMMFPGAGVDEPFEAQVALERRVQVVTGLLPLVYLFDLLLYL